MPQKKTVICAIVFIGSLLCGNLRGAPAKPRRDKSLLLESKAAIARALQYLEDKQQENGSWRDNPAFTGLIVTAMVGSGMDEYGAGSETVQKALAYIRKHARPNGGIYEKYYANYTTCICVMALIEAGQPEDKKLVRKAKEYPLNLQVDESEDMTTKDNQYGGWGYEKHQSGKGMHRADMSNTQLALEAVHALQQAVEEDKPEDGAGKTRTELAFDKALVYLQKCQKKDGGFVYRPNESKAGRRPDGTLRTYAGMTYAGLKSMIYARVDRNDRRVKAAMDWVSKHWTVERNPGIGQQGLYYYYQTLAKALNAANVEVIVGPKGERHDWRKELVSHLLKVQKENGSWVNENGRWMEQIPELVTSYSVLAIEQATRKW
ncbi:MAG: terpene cyclase/mutase family protein [Planctomycetes bacterium]|nr:terpene cyclase/mutase family protein [Planctomycetota bacterium]